jgi:hypothetical protein
MLGPREQLACGYAESVAVLPFAGSRRNVSMRGHTSQAQAGFAGQPFLPSWRTALAVRGECLYEPSCV